MRDPPPRQRDRDLGPVGHEELFEPVVRDERVGGAVDVDREAGEDASALFFFGVSFVFFGVFFRDGICGGGGGGGGDRI